MKSEQLFRVCEYRNCNETVHDGGFFCSRACERYHWRETPFYSRIENQDVKSLARTKLFRQLKGLLEEDWRSTNYYVCKYNQSFRGRAYKTIYRLLLGLQSEGVLESKLVQSCGAMREGRKRFWRLTI